MFIASFFDHRHTERDEILEAGHLPRTDVTRHLPRRHLDPPVRTLRSMPSSVWIRIC